MRLFLFFLCLYIFYKLFKSSSKAKSEKARVVYPPRNASSTSSTASQSLVVDEMKRCPTCGTFNPSHHALEAKGQFFCDEKCLKENK